MATAVAGSERPDLHLRDAGRKAYQAAVQLVPSIVSLRAEAERLRQTPPSLVQALSAAGLYQMYLPGCVGGGECDPLTVIQIIEELSAADASMGWCAALATNYTLLTGWLDPEVLEKIAGDPPDVRLAGSLRPEGIAQVVPGGYRVSGKFLMASGIDHANWLTCLCVIMDGDKPVLTSTGAPKAKLMWMPASAAKRLDTWSAVGMCATASHDFLIEDEFVPEPFSSSMAEAAFQGNPLYSPRTALVYVWSGQAANALGIARGAVDALVGISTREASSASATPLRDRAPVQSKVGEATAILQSARSYFLRSVEETWDAVTSGTKDLDLQIAHTRLAITHSIRESIRAVDLVFHAAGTASVYRRNPLEKFFRDIHVAAQHNAGAFNHYESAGKVFLGLRPSDAGW